MSALTSVFLSRCVLFVYKYTHTHSVYVNASVYIPVSCILSRRNYCTCFFLLLFILYARCTFNSSNFDWKRDVIIVILTSNYASNWALVFFSRKTDALLSLTVSDTYHKIRKFRPLNHNYYTPPLSTTVVLNRVLSARRGATIEKITFITFAYTTAYFTERGNRPNVVVLNFTR